MKDKSSRIIAIIALVFMGIFVVTLTVALFDLTLYGGAPGYIAIGSGAIGVALFVVLKMTGHGFSVTEMKNQAEMERIRKELEAETEKAETENKDEADKRH